MSEPATTQPAAPPCLSPKAQFLRLVDDANKWRQQSRSDHMYTILTYAFAEFCLSSSPTSEQTKAVRDFIEIFLNLAEPKNQGGFGFPQKRLDSSLMSPPIPERKPTEPKKQ